MTKLKENIKRMLSALAYQNANEYLSSYEKMKMIGDVTETKVRPNGSVKSERKAKIPGIALIIDNHENEASLRYTIEACQRQGARVDLLLHGAIDSEKIKKMEEEIIRSGIACKHIQLGTHAINDIIKYLFTRSDLIYLVANPDDSLVRTLIEKELPERDLRIPVPLVLMSNKDCPVDNNRSVA